MSRIGIDFGNKYVRIFEIRDGNTEVITNELGERRFINLLAFRDEKRYISYEVENNLTGLTPFSFYHLRDWIFNDKPIPNLDKILKFKKLKKPIKLHILVIILNYLIEKVKKPLNHCVISLDYPLPYILKQNIILIIKKLGFKRVTISNDMVALSLSYGYIPIIKNEFTDKTLICLFIDIGELGTKIGVIHYNKKDISILENNYYKDIGSYYLQLHIINYLKDHLSSEYNITISLENNYLLHEISFTIIKNLVIMPSYFVNEEIGIGDKSYKLNLKITRDIIENLVKNWKQQLNNILTKYNKNYLLDNVFLVGNGSRIHIFKDIISEIFGDKLKKTLNIEESVVKGCVIQAKDRKNCFTIKKKILDNIYLRIDGYGENLLIFKKDTFEIKKEISLPQWSTNPSIYLRYGDYGDFNLINYLQIRQNKPRGSEKLTFHFLLNESDMCILKKIILNDFMEIHITHPKFNTTSIDNIIETEKKFLKNLKLDCIKVDLIYQLESLFNEISNLVKENNKIIKLKVNKSDKEQIRNNLNISKQIINNSKQKISLDYIKMQIIYMKKIKSFLLELKSKFFTV